MADKVKKEVWEEHDVVYHYTTQAGLEGILDSQVLHATHFRCVNDSSEMMHMEPYLAVAVLPSIKSFLQNLSTKYPNIRKQVARDGGLDTIALKEAHKIASGLYNVTFGRQRDRNFFEPYLVSFCAHPEEYERENGLLSQWRGYGKDSGYAIVFKTKGLVDMIQEDGARYFHFPGFFGDVVYEGDQARFKDEFSGLLAILERVYPNMLERQDFDFKTLYADFIGSVGRFKHKGFAEEREVRIVVSPFKASDVNHFKSEQPDDFKKNAHKLTKEIKFKFGLDPYICIPGIDGKLPIARIIVGPHKHKEERKVALDRYLQLIGMDIPVTTSATPLV